MYDYLKGIGGDLIDDAKLQEFCDNAVADMTWLEDMGVKVQDVEAIHQSLTPWRVHNTLGGGGMTDGHGGQITVPMTEKFLGLGGQILYNVSADTLLTDDSGVVCGASGTRPDGTTVSVNAKAVVIATGGYAANTELVEEYTGKTGYVTQVPAGNVGDGLTMAEAVGAAIYKPTTIQTVFTSFTCGVGINEEAGLDRQLARRARRQRVHLPVPRCRSHHQQRLLQRLVHRQRRRPEPHGGSTASRSTARSRPLPPKSSAN